MGELDLKQTSIFKSNKYNLIVILHTQNGDIIRRANQHQVDTELVERNCEMTIVADAESLTEDELFALDIRRSFAEIPILSEEVIKSVRKHNSE